MNPREEGVLAVSRPIQEQTCGFQDIDAAGVRPQVGHVPGAVESPVVVGEVERCRSAGSGGDLYRLVRGGLHQDVVRRPLPRETAHGVVFADRCQPHVRLARRLPSHALAHHQESTAPVCHGEVFDHRVREWGDLTSLITGDVATRAPLPGFVGVRGELKLEHEYSK